jgi:DNA-nicking Smr family endonuclease
LRGFIWRCHSAGHRTVLVITGKGTRQKDPHPDAPPWAMGSGILKRAVPGWLSAADMRAAVLSVEPAHASHGGEGALYVRLRANRGAA